MGPALQAGRRPGQGGTRGTLFCPHSLGSLEPACHEGLEGPSGGAMWDLPWQVEHSSAGSPEAQSWGLRAAPASPLPGSPGAGTLAGTSGKGSLLRVSLTHSLLTS